jgi:hypothetical protein
VLPLVQSNMQRQALLSSNHTPSPLHCLSTKVALYSVEQIGFFALLALEGVMGKGILELLGVATGKGLNLQF